MPFKAIWEVIKATLCTIIIACIVVIWVYALLVG